MEKQTQFDKRILRYMNWDSKKKSKEIQKAKRKITELNNSLFGFDESKATAEQVREMLNKNINKKVQYFRDKIRDIKNTY